VRRGMHTEPGPRLVVVLDRIDLNLDVGLDPLGKRHHRPGPRLPCSATTPSASMCAAPRRTQACLHADCACE
jgi:hypothetical protein